MSAGAEKRPSRLRPAVLIPVLTVLTGLWGVLTIAASQYSAAAPLVLVRFVSGKLSATTLAELVAEVRGVFAEPEEARNFAAAVWGALPQYGVSGFTELAADEKSAVEFAEQDGFFTATGRIKAYFA